MTKPASLSYASRSDANQSSIVADLRRLGFDVDVVHRLKGLYDLVVSGLPTWADRAVAVRVEVKTPRGRLTDGEKEYWDSQKHDNLIVARCAEDVLAWFGRGG